MGVAVDLVPLLRIDAAAAADDAVAGGHRDVEPDLVGVGGALREQVAELQGPDDRLEEVRLPRLERRHHWAQRRMEWAIDPRAIADPEDVDPGDLLEELRVGLDHVAPVLEPRQPRVRGGEEMIVDGEAARVVVALGAEVGRTF